MRTLNRRGCVPLWYSSEVMALNAREKRIKKKKRVHACNFSKRTQRKPARERSSLVCMRQSFVLPLVQFHITEKIAF